ncbi:DUF4865 family protein [Rugamonas sp. CCM 8940]|uniref:DUF4865 family protein n=1 Tax=Rugamonas sp. CCM 8940 TaxID=2765359 RepID=UPI0018F41436|nr:DUF4865 family protein [Rugamonas sp. CCM 8940]MBJ7311539.1 DUF4865 family protein [Rugamonas sp. CCM 8940]
MIAMQYSFVLPADYDMRRIDARIADKGHLLDGFPGLRFKAYLSAERDDAALASADNLYAPFYLWDGSEGMNAFLGGAGFAAVTQAFGRPSVATWSVWTAALGDDLARASHATRELLPIAPHTPLDQLRQQEEAAAQQALQGADGAVAALACFDPSNWTLLRLRLWRGPRGDAVAGRQQYRVGYVALPRRPAAAAGGGD